MEPPRGILASLWSFICFLPYFIGLLLLGFIKGKVSNFNPSGELFLDFTQLGFLSTSGINFFFL